MSGTGRPAVDWERLKQRLAEAEDALARGHAGTPDNTPEKRRAMLEARARAMAQRARADETPHAIAVVEFELAGRRFAVDAAFVGEVRVLDALTPLPCTPDFVAGIVNVHGRILAVIDLAVFLQLPQPGLGELDKVIILQQGETEFGVLADRIVGAHRVPLADLQAPPPALGGVHAGCIRALAPGPLIVLQAERLLSEPALLVDDDLSS